ncbi:MAG TPA: hypothetical protein VMT37_07600 [Solirubrobacterales bacterium]|nr:hypothetical protein [Solirubrobacterales bacterium]
MHSVVAWKSAGLAVLAAILVAAVAVSGGSGSDPRTPAALPGMPPPFLGTAVTGGGGTTAAVDAYGDVVDLRPSPAGPALIDNSSARQAAGTVPADTGIVPRVSLGGGPALPLWRADSVTQRYLPRTNVVRTEGRFGETRVAVITAAEGDELAVVVRIWPEKGQRMEPSVGVSVAGGVRCARDMQGGQLDLLCRVGRAVPPALGAAAQDIPEQARAVIRQSASDDRRWLGRAEALGSGAPAWAEEMYRRSLLVLRALTDSRTGAVAAGARDGWAYVWPRDAATAALALRAAGYEGDARRVARFLSRLNLDAAARFEADGSPVPGRAAQGDANGWVRAAERATAVVKGSRRSPELESAASALPWRGRADYQEGSGGEYLGNAIAAGAPLGPFATPKGLVRQAGDPASGLDSAAAWAVRPFPRRGAFPAVRRTLLRLLATGTRYGITPGEGWSGGSDPWTAPTAWSAWALAALGDRAAALHLLGDLRRAATPAGALPERVDARTGTPRSTTPLAWSHAFTVLTLLQLWPTHHRG